MSDELFATAPEEVLRYFRAKQSQPTFDWRDVAPEEHAFAFTVAKSTTHDVLDDIRSALDDAITNRVPFDAFRERLTPVLQEKGWWGRQIATDPKDGSDRIVQLGSPRRLRTIYWANTRTAHAAGEWERTERNKAFLPFLLYTRSVAEKRRPEHEGWVGTALPVDDPWWDRHFPPNGWGCQCGTRQITEAEARRRGWRPETEAPSDTMRPWRNRRTGETVDIPQGIDPGWDTNPGRNRARNVSEFLHGRIEAMPAHRQSVAIADIVGSPMLKALADGRMRTGAFLPVAQLPAGAAEELGARSRLVNLSADSVGHILHQHAARGLTVGDFRQALEIVARPAAVLRHGKVVALLGEAAGRWWRVVVKGANEGRELWLVSFHRKSAKDARDMIERGRRQGRLVD